MTKSEKLFEMLKYIREYPNLTASDLALLCNVSERGVYRYLKTLSRAGISIRFDGHGYRLTKDMFDLLKDADIESLMAAKSLLALGLKNSNDDKLSKHGKNLIELIEENLPRDETTTYGRIQILPPEAEPSHRGGTITIGHSSIPSIINPILTSDTISVTLTNLLFSSLVDFDINRNIIPDLAKSWEVSRNGLVWTFYLREDVKFHDGHPLTAEDLEFTYRTIMDPKSKSPIAERYELLDGFETEGDYIFRIFLKYPSAPFLGRVTWPIAPKHLLENADICSTEFNHNPIGSGPFKMSEWRKDNTIVLEANPHYFQQDRPIIDKLIFKVYPDRKSAIQAINTGEMDISLNLTTPDVLFMNGGRKFRTYATLNSSYYALFFNLDDPLFRDLRVRMAMDYAIDKEAIIKNQLKGYGEICTGPFGVRSWANNPEIQPTPHSVENARMLLSQAGWRSETEDGPIEKDGKPFEMTVMVPSAHDVLERIAVGIKAQLAKSGIRTKLVMGGASETKNGFQAILARAIVGTDPDYTYSFWHSQGGGGVLASYSNPSVDSLLEQGRRISDMEQRKNIYRRIHEIIHDDYPAIFLVSGSEFIGSNYDFSDAKFSSTLHFFTTMKDWQIIGNNREI